MQWNCFDIQAGKTFDVKIKFLTPRWSICNAFILWNSKNTWFCLCEDDFIL